LRKSVKEWNSFKHARGFAEKVAVNRVVDAGMLQSGDFAVDETLVWQGSLRAILDASLCQQERCVKADDVKEIVGLFRNLTSRGFWVEQHTFEQSEGEDSNGKQVFDVRPMEIHNEMGYWAHIDSVPDWPWG
jgi:hypothetical protein